MNTGITTTSTGERRISEPSTVLSSIFLVSLSVSRSNEYLFFVSLCQVVSNELVRHLCVIKVWLCASILNCKHILVVKRKQKEGPQTPFLLLKSSQSCELLFLLVKLSYQEFPLTISVKFSCQFFQCYPCGFLVGTPGTAEMSEPQTLSMSMREGQSWQARSFG